MYIFNTSMTNFNQLEKKMFPRVIYFETMPEAVNKGYWNNSTFTIDDESKVEYH